MWFWKKPSKQEKRIQETKAATFEAVDRVINSVDKNTAQLEKLNRKLERDGDIAYAIFRATPGGGKMFGGDKDKK